MFKNNNEKWADLIFLINFWNWFAVPENGFRKIQSIHLLPELAFPTKPNPQFSEISAGVCLGENIVILKKNFFMVDLALKMATLRYCSRRLLPPAPWRAQGLKKNANTGIGQPIPILTDLKMLRTKC
jgi:hypothetical protein